MMWIALVGAILSTLGPAWAAESRREREREFVFRAEQYKNAISAYAEPINVNGCLNLRELPAMVADLLEDRRCGMVRHHLRRAYSDPITRANDWVFVLDGGRIRGLHSRSTRTVMRHIQGIATYKDWVFLATPPLRAIDLGTVTPPSAASIEHRVGVQ